MSNKKERYKTMSNKTGYKKSVTLRKRKLKNGKVSLYLDIYLGSGKRQYEFLGITYHIKNIPEKRQKLEIAKEIATKREIELISNDNGIISAYKKRSNFVEYFEQIAFNTPKTEKAWKNTYKYLNEFTKGHIQFNAIDENFLEEFKTFLLTKVSNNTAHTYFAKIKASLNKAVKDKIVNKNIANNVKQIARNDVKRTYLTIDELNKLNKTSCNKIQVKYAFMFACNTGLRLSDVKRLSWNDISLDEKRLILSQKKTKESLYLPLNNTALNILSKIKSNKVQDISNKVFVLPTDNQINNVIKKWVKKANITKKVTFHISRHTFATISLASGTDLYTVSKLLGHKDIQNTQIYTKVINESMVKAVNNIPEIDVI